MTQEQIPTELQDTFKKYVSAMRAMEDFRFTHKHIFAQHESLAHVAIGARARLEDAAANANKGISDGNYEVKLIPQEMTFADIEVIDRLIAEGKISSTLRDEIVKTIPRPAHIVIKPVQQI